VVSGFFYWWYSAGTRQAWDVFALFIFRVYDFFSLDILVKTWFAPWKNDVLTANNIALSDQVKLWEANFVSRLIGALARTVVIFFSLIILAVSFVALTLLFTVWVLMPVLWVVLPVLAGYIALRS